MFFVFKEFYFANLLNSLFSLTHSLFAGFFLFNGGVDLFSFCFSFVEHLTLVWKKL